MIIPKALKQKLQVKKTASQTNAGGSGSEDSKLLIGQEFLDKMKNSGIDVKPKTIIS